MNILTLPILLDVVVAAVLLLFAIMDGKRGLVLSLVGLAGVLIALAGAGFASRQLSPTVGAWLQPRISDSVEAAVTSVWGGEDHSAGGRRSSPSGAPRRARLCWRSLACLIPWRRTCCAGFPNRFSDAGKRHGGDARHPDFRDHRGGTGFCGGVRPDPDCPLDCRPCAGLAFRLPVLRTLNTPAGRSSAWPRACSSCSSPCGF